MNKLNKNRERYENLLGRKFNELERAIFRVGYYQGFTDTMILLEEKIGLDIKESIDKCLDVWYNVFKIRKGRNNDEY